MTASPKALQRLQSVLDRFEISIAEANDLVALQDYRIAIIADDSGSMQNSAEPLHERHLGKPSRSRWAELKDTIAEIVEIATCFSSEGINVHFLNRTPVMQVKAAVDHRLLDSFSSPPQGSTPLTETIRRVAQSMKGEHGTLLFIFTDGEPNGGRKPFRDALRTLVKESNVRVQIMACTADESVMEWLGGIDYEFSEVDVTDDFHSERQEVLRSGLAPRFTRGDWCMKAMLGPVSQKYDLWDEQLKPFKTPECDLACSIM